MKKFLFGIFLIFPSLSFSNVIINDKQKLINTNEIIRLINNSNNIFPIKIKNITVNINSHSNNYYANTLNIKNKCIINLYQNNINKNNLNYFKFVFLHELSHCYYKNIPMKSIKWDKSFNKDSISIINNKIKEYDYKLINKNISINEHPYILLNELGADVWATYIWKKTESIDYLKTIYINRLNDFYKENNIYYSHDAINYIINNDIKKSDLDILIQKNFISLLLLRD